MRTPSSLIILLLLAALCIQTVDAQKKKQPAEKKESQTTQTVPTPQIQPIRASATFRDWLAQYQGMPTNIGTLTKVGPDYILVEEEGATTAHPIHAIQTVRLVKRGEEEGTKLEIRLLTKD